MPILGHDGRHRRPLSDTRLLGHDDVLGHDGRRPFSDMTDCARSRIERTMPARGHDGRRPLSHATLHARTLLTESPTSNMTGGASSVVSDERGAVEEAANMDSLDRREVRNTVHHARANEKWPRSRLPTVEESTAHEHRGRDRAPTAPSWKWPRSRSQTHTSSHTGDEA